MICNLCPRKCGVDRASKLGVCGASDKMQVALYQLHMWEEPPISGDAGSGTIFFSHCPLKCVYCQNHQISSEGRGSEVSVEDVANMMLDLQSRGALNINIVTGTHYEPQIKKAILLAREQGLTLPIVWNTSSYETPEMIRDLNEVVDIYLADFKYYDNDLGCKFSSISDYREVATLAIDEMLPSGCGGCSRGLEGEERQTFLSEKRRTRSATQPPNRSVIIRHLILPGHIDDSKKVIEHVWNRWGDAVKLSIMNQYTPVLKDSKYPELLRKVTDEEYEEVLDFADALGIEDYFWQDGETSCESFIPRF